jgi:hypothetical protein
MKALKLIPALLCVPALAAADTDCDSLTASSGFVHAVRSV